MTSKHAKRDLISLKKEYTSINGKKMRVISIVEPGVSVVLPFIDSSKDTIIIERQYRPALRKYIYELPALAFPPYLCGRLAARICICATPAGIGALL